MTLNSAQSFRVVKVADGNYVTLTEEKKYTRITILSDCPILKAMSSALLMVNFKQAQPVVGTIQIPTFKRPCLFLHFDDFVRFF